MNKSLEIEVKVGIFVILGIGLIMLTILLLGGGQSIFQRSIHFHAMFPQIEGLVEGATVKIAGVRVGQVNKISLSNQTGHVDVAFTIADKFKEAVRQDSLVGIQTQGVLGDRYLVIHTGSNSSPLASEGSELKIESPKELKDYLNNADEVLARLKNSLSHMESILGSFNNERRAEIFFKNIAQVSTNATDGTKNLKESMSHLNSVISKIDNGHGTLGALINDPSLYDDLKALLGGANRNKVLKYFIKKSVEESREAAERSKNK